MATEEEFEILKQRLGQTERVSRELLLYLEIASHCDWIHFQRMITDDAFGEFIERLEERHGWNKEDEKRAIELAREFQEQASGKTLADKRRAHREALIKLLKAIGMATGVVASAAGIGTAGYLLGKKY